MTQHFFEAMGTWVEAWCHGDIEELERWFETVEGICSRFRPGSELNQINESTETRHLLSPILSEILKCAEHVRLSTGGIVDVGVGAAVSAWGYDRTFADVVDLPTVPRIVDRPEWALEDGVLVKAPGTRIDLGGIAKGWACDRATENGLATVVSAGGDIRSLDPETVVPVVDPWGAEAAIVRLGVGGLATSSISRRRWQVAGIEANHLIDPRTLAPVRSPIQSATVVAESASAAEAGAKAVLLKGEEGLAWADETAWIRAALVVWHDGSVYATTGVELAA